MTNVIPFPVAKKAPTPVRSAPIKSIDYLDNEVVLTLAASEHFEDIVLRGDAAISYMSGVGINFTRATSR
jgi:hypothetical protein